MKHYTSSELIAMMDELGYWFDKDASYPGYLSFQTTDDGWSGYSMYFSTWKKVAEYLRNVRETL